MRGFEREDATRETLALDDEESVRSAAPAVGLQSDDRDPPVRPLVAR